MHEVMEEKPKQTSLSYNVQADKPQRFLFNVMMLKVISACKDKKKAKEMQRDMCLSLALLDVPPAQKKRTGHG
ncbi:hypothetical protein ACEQPO_22205 [Bacillus sp. SL00103]